MDHYKKIKEANSDASLVDLRAMVSKQYAELSPLDKKKYTDMAEKQKEEQKKIKEAHKNLKQPRKLTAYNCFVSAQFLEKRKMEEFKSEWSVIKNDPTKMQEWELKAEATNREKMRQWEEYVQTAEAKKLRKIEDEWENMHVEDVHAQEA